MAGIQRPPPQFNRPPMSPQQAAMFRIVLLRMLQQEAMRQQQQGQEQKGPDFGKVVEDILKDQAKDQLRGQANGQGNDVLGSLFGGGSNTAQAATESAGAASQVAWNAGADAATAGGQAASDAVLGNGLYTEAPGAMQMTPAGGEATQTGSPNYGGYIAAAASLYNSGRQITDKNARDEQQAYDASMAVPRAVAAYYTGGLSTLAEGFARKQWGGTMKKLDKFNQTNPLSPVFVPMMASRLWTSNEWKKEGNRLRDLEKKGIMIPESMKTAMNLQQGRSKDQLVNKNFAADFVGNDGKGGWVNNKFANSRDTNDLKKEDIWGYSAFSEKFGNDWWNKFSTQQRADIAQAALDNKAVKEHHGTIDINWNPQLDSSIKTILGNADGGNKPAPYKPGQSMDSFINYASAGLGNSAPPQAQQPQWRRGQTVRLSPGVYRGPDGKIQRGK